MSKHYKVNVLQQGKAVLGESAYVAKESKDIICMYLDAWGETGRAYPIARSQYCDYENNKKHPCIWYYQSDNDEGITEIYFPELEDWEIFALGGGKTCSIVLTKGSLFE